MRVIAGSVGGRRLDAPGGVATRPTSDRVREAIFNTLTSLDVLDGARVLDAFAGSGALGIEALSRGAAHVTFAETDRGARDVVQSNIASLALHERARVIGGPAAEALRRYGPWDLVLLDPPYGFDEWKDLLGVVAEHLGPQAVVVIESDREPTTVPGLDVLRFRKYGGTVVGFLTPSGADR